MTKNEHLAETLLLGLGQSELPLQTTASRALHSPGELATARLSSPRGTRCEARGTSEHTAFTGDAHVERERGRSGFSQPHQELILACSASLEGQPRLWAP